MQFDFGTFSQIAAGAYEADNPYTLEQCLAVFRWYFDKYEATQGHPHPPLRADQIGRIMRVMPWIYQEDIGLHCPDIDHGSYELLIKLHFMTKYRRCDYNINHFFSGRIRELRSYEVNAAAVKDDILN